MAQRQPQIYFTSLSIFAGDFYSCIPSRLSCALTVLSAMIVLNLSVTRLQHGDNENKYLNFPACVWTVTENPRTPNVFLQVQNTEYLAEK